MYSNILIFINSFWYILCFMKFFYISTSRWNFCLISNIFPGADLGIMLANSNFFYPYTLRVTQDNSFDFWLLTFDFRPAVLIPIGEHICFLSTNTDSSMINFGISNDHIIHWCSIYISIVNLSASQIGSVEIGCFKINVSQHSWS